MRALALLLLSLLVGRAPAADFEVTPVLTGLEYPWCLAFLPSGGFLVTERVGRLKYQDADGAVREIGGLPSVYVRSQAGLFDVLPAPDFERSGRVFLSYAHGTGRANGLRVASARLVGETLTDLEVIFRALPLKDTPVHYGGRMVLLPDGTLLITTGDGFDYREAAQRLDNHLGKTIRIGVDGSVPADNPFLGEPEALPEIWTYGHRNPQGLVVDAARGVVYLHEHGPRGGDELNRLVAGANYGWPIVTEGLDYNGAYVTPFRSRAGTEAPLLTWTPSIAPAGMTLYRGTRHQAWDGDLLVAALAEQSLRVIDLDEAGQVLGQALALPLRDRRLRDVRTGPDGAIYLLTDEADGAILRVTPGGTR